MTPASFIVRIQPAKPSEVARHRVADQCYRLVASGCSPNGQTTATGMSAARDSRLSIVDGNPSGGGAQLPRVTVIGTGYLGLTHAVCLADLGHEVLAIDIDEDKIAKAANGEALFFEPGLEPLLRKNLDAGRLRFTTSFAEVGAFGAVHFLCVGTPEGESGEADLRFVHAAADALAPYLATECLIVGKSTVPVGTARQVMSQVRAIAPAGRQVDLAWNPEFLREGHAVQDSLTPDRIVVGVTSDRAEALLREVYATPLAGGVPLLVMVYARSVSEAAQDAELVLHLTEWADYQAIDPAALGRVVARRVIIDARCCLDAG